MPGLFIQVAGYNNDMEGWKGDNACHDFGVAVSKKSIPTETKADIVFRSFLKRVSLPNQSAVVPGLEFNTYGRRPTVQYSVVEKEDPAAERLGILSDPSIRIEFT